MPQTTYKTYNSLIPLSLGSTLLERFRALTVGRDAAEVIHARCSLLAESLPAAASSFPCTRAKRQLQVCHSLISSGEGGVVAGHPMRACASRALGVRDGVVSAHQTSAFCTHERFECEGACQLIRICPH